MAGIKVVVWSGTGNTMEMCSAVAEGIAAGGAEADIIAFAGITPAELAAESKFAMGCPAMGAEVLEEGEVEPFMTELEGIGLAGKKIALFGSYGWGDGEWMRSWEDRVRAAGAEIINGAGVIANNAPDDGAKEECKALGTALANA